MPYVVATIDAIVAAVAGSTILILVDVAALVGTARLRWAWRTLGSMLACCVALLLVHATISFGLPADARDLVGAAVFLIGVSFIFGTACLSRSTARHLLRVQRVAQVAHVDALTGIGNRRHFGETLEAAVREVGRSTSPLSVIVFDIDRFKAVNDAYGHALGDEVFRQVARLSSERTRPAGTIYRVGSEEFAIIVPRSDPVFVHALAEQLRKSVATLRIDMGEGRDLSVTISLGLASLAVAETGAELLRRADAALYDAKRAGRDRLGIAV